MAKFADISGQRFGTDDHWVEAIKMVDPYISPEGKRYGRWLCRCKCGKEFITTLNNLRKGYVTSCGCRRNASSSDIFIGQTFGILTVVSEAAPILRSDGKHRTASLCKCKCGNELVVSNINLKSRHTKSCGCLVNNRVDLTGQIFGSLTVLCKCGNKNGHSLWKCRCVCGSEIVVSSDSLTLGRTVSCGCIHSKGESKLARIITEIGFEFEKQCTFATCRNPDTGALLPFDFHLPNHNLLIEYDGVQHMRFTNGWNTQESHIGVIHRDNIKNRWCRENNQQLIRIPYTELPRIDAAYMLTLMRLAAMEEDEELVCPV